MQRHSVSEHPILAASRPSKAICQQLKIKWALVKNSPLHILGPPFILLALLLGLGIWGVLAVAHGQENTAKELALNVAVLTGESLQLFIERLILPGNTLAALMELSGSWESFQPFFQSVASVLVSQVPPNTITAIDAAPNGIWLDRYPRKDIPPEVANGGIDEIKNEPYRTSVLNFIASHQMDLNFVIDPNEVGGPTLVCFAHSPMYKSNVSANETFGLEPGIDIADCGPCYDPATRTKYMGAFGTGLNLSSLSSLAVPSLQRLHQDGYLLRLTRDAMGGTEELLLAQTEKPATDSPVRVKIPLPGNTTWTLDIEPSSGWSSVWVAPAVAAVVIFAVMASLLLLLVLLSRREHQMLLLSLVPRAVIARVKTTDDFVSSAKESAIESGTPAAKILEVASDLLEGKMPAMKDVLLMRTAILQSYNLYEPIDLKQQLTDTLDHDVARALMAQLGRGTTILRMDTDLSAHLFRTDPSQHSTSTAPSDKPITLATALGNMMLMDQSALSSMRYDALTPTANLKRCSGVSDAVSSGNWALGYLPLLPPRTPSGASYLEASPPSPIIEEVESFLSASACSWDFNAFQLDSVTQGHGLSTLTYFLAHEAGLITRLKLEPEYFARFLRKIEDGYRRNPYHNSTHASDVLHTLHLILCRGGMMPGYVNPLTQLACYLAAAIHDFDHVGLTNDFLVLSSDPLAILYNDRAPMENHHIAAAFSILKSPGCDFLFHLSTSDMATLRKTIIDLVLGTDMKQHFSILSQFCNIHGLTDKRREEEGLDSRPSSALRQEQRNSRRGDQDTVGPPALRPLDESDRTLSLQMALKCSDLSSLTKPLEIHHRWVCLLEDEFFLQGDREKLMGLPVSPLFDRDKPGLTKCQTGFFSFVASPLFSSFTRVFKGADQLYRNLLRNQAYWAEREPASKEGPTS